MIPRFKVRTEIPYLINIWGKGGWEQLLYMLPRTLSTSLFLFKQLMNQFYVTIGYKKVSWIYFYIGKLKAWDPKPLNIQRAGAVPLQRALPRAAALPPASSLALALASSSSPVLSQTHFSARLALPQLSFPVQLTTSAWVSTGERTNSW